MKKLTEILKVAMQDKVYVSLLFITAAVAGCCVAWVVAQMS